MKTEQSVRRRLAALEKEMEAQVIDVSRSDQEWGGPKSLFWDKRCIERATLRWVMGMKSKQFCPADIMAGW